MASKTRKFPPAAVYDIKIPRGLPRLDGKLTRKQRVEVAMDALALLKLRSRSRKIVLGSYYFAADIPESGQLHSSVIQGECMVCARGLMFLASVDRFDRCDLEKVDCYDEAQDRTVDEWGYSQADLIEGAFENGGLGTRSHATQWFYRRHVRERGDRRRLMRAICQNIIDNHGEFIP